MTPASGPTDALPQGATLADLGEFGLLARLFPVFPQGPQVTVGPGDDAAEVSVPGGRVLVATDVLVEGRHFRRDWAGAGDIGRRAAAQSLSDLNAMGGTATAVTVGLVAPPTLEAAWVLELATGLAEECDEAGASVVGGDLTNGELLTLAVTAVGVVEGRPVLRSGARPGDRVAIRGRQGWAAAGLAVLARGFRSPRAVVEAYRRPLVPYAAGREALALGATALIDVSDGLLADLGHIAAASGVAVDLHADAFTVEEPLQAVGAALGVDPMTFVLGGGDDHPLVGAFPAGVDLPAGWTVIGDVEAPDDDRPAGVVRLDGVVPDIDPGHRHF